MNWLHRLKRLGELPGRLPHRDQLDADPPPVPRPHAEPPAHAASDVSYPVRLAAAWSWRLVAIAAAIYVVVRFITVVQIVVIPIAVSFLLAALLQPLAAWLQRRGLPASLAAAIVMVTGLAAVVGTLTAVVRAFIKGFTDLTDQVNAGLDEIRNWLVEGPLHLSEEQIDEAVDAAQRSISDNHDLITSGAVSTATTVAHIISGFFLVLFTTFFFVKDGDKIWSFALKFTPQSNREQVREAGYRAWRTLISYVRAQVLVAFVDAVGIGLAVWLLGVPLALPLAALVFMASFIPIIGAVLSGSVAVLVALVADGPITALILLALVIAVQQIEGHVLQPLLMGRAVSVHPLGVVLAIAAGAVLAGIVGALVAVPLVATVNTAASYLANNRSGGFLEPVEAPDPEPEAAT